MDLVEYNMYFQGVRLVLVEKIQLGQLVRILADRSFTDDGLATTVADKRGITLYEKIDLTSYPSCNDFLGRTSTATAGDVGTIIRFIGSPRNVRGGKDMSQYDVYEILIDGEFRQVFRNNIEVSPSIPVT
jgi:hypothetical protein